MRDYIHVADLAAAHLLALATMDAPGSTASTTSATAPASPTAQVVEVVRAVTGHPIPVEMAPRRPGDPAALVASSAKARAELGWTPQKPDLPDIVADAWTFFQALEFKFPLRAAERATAVPASHRSSLGAPAATAGPSPVVAETHRQALARDPVPRTAPRPLLPRSSGLRHRPRT